MPGRRVRGVADVDFNREGNDLDGAGLTPGAPWRLVSGVLTGRVSDLVQVVMQAGP